MNTLSFSYIICRIIYCNIYVVGKFTDVTKF